MKKLVGLFLCLFLTACETPYAKQNLFLTNNYGYDELALTPTSYLVNFRGTSADTPQRVFRKLFYRAAEVAKQNGVEYFTIESFQSNSEVRESVLPGFSSSSTSGAVMVDPYAGTANFNSQTTGINIPAQTIRSKDITMQTVIKLVKDPAKAGKNKLVDVEFILKNWK